MADQLPDRPKARSLKPLRALWPYLRVYRKTLVLALGIGSTVSVFTLINGALLAQPPFPQPGCNRVLT